MNMATVDAKANVKRAWCAEAGLAAYIKVKYPQDGAHPIAVRRDEPDTLTDAAIDLLTDLRHLLGDEYGQVNDIAGRHYADETGQL